MQTQRTPVTLATDYLPPAGKKNVSSTHNPVFWVAMYSGIFSFCALLVTAVALAIFFSSLFINWAVMGISPSLISAVGWVAKWSAIVTAGSLSLTALSTGILCLHALSLGGSAPRLEHMEM